MGKDLHIREIDEKEHASLTKIADSMGVSINSIVKDAIDKWLLQKSQIPKKHIMLIYDDEKAVVNLLKSIDKIAQEQGWFRAFCASPKHISKKDLSKLGWFDGSVLPYKPENVKYFSKIEKKILEASKQKPLFVMDFALSDLASSSIANAIKIERDYDKDPHPGIFFCPYKIEDVTSSSVNECMELFLMHDPFYILKDNELYKFHITKESPHKLFLD
ncbi:hypothetical protein C6988_06795 [Nitrosopumilus sp. b1]|uniref:hypothetical protein n=1 Tax=Nitrosopumilus sp. b1 TaxID=2109907 RepID=UPI0015F7030F|nr:hypothetical protein [Nitrosopumilus sp. b1]KAF6242875.1 hypothetical protein C6988_06795 [Nitrosopumilus sp. b1]